MSMVLVGSLLVAASLPMTLFFKGLLMMSVLIYGAWIFWTTGLMRGSAAIIGLNLLADGSCYLQHASQKRAATVQSDSTVTTALCVLRFSVPGQRRKVSCVIFKDALEQEMYRKLLVWLRCVGVKHPKS